MSPAMPTYGLACAKQYQPPLIALLDENPRQPFTYPDEKKGREPDRMDMMNNSAYQKARKRAQLTQVLELANLVQHTRVTPTLLRVVNG